jgi:DNA-binding MarR family transcriptional regulator
MAVQRRRNDDTRTVLDAVRRIVRFLRQNAAADGPLGITSAQRFVLQTLAAARTLSVNELAQRTYTDQSTVSVVAKRLVERGLVARERSPDDGRRVDLALTRRGRELLGRKAPDAPSAQLVAALSTLDATTRRQLATSLTALVREMGLDLDPAPMLFEDGLDRRRTPRRA